MLSCKRKKIIESKPKLNIEKVEETKEKSKIINSTFASENIFGIWSTNLNNPNMDVEITEKSFSFKDYQNNKPLIYKINNNKIEVFLHTFVQTGLIKKAENDSLVIYWASGEYITYLRRNR